MARYIHGLLLFPAAFLTLVCSKAYAVAKAAPGPGAWSSDHEDLVEANSKLAVGGAIVGFLAAIPGVAHPEAVRRRRPAAGRRVVFVVCGLSAPSA